MTVDEKLDLLIQEMSGMKADMLDMKSRIDKVDNRLDKVDSRLDKLERKTADTNIILENIVQRSISVVAEGHLDLMRKLDEALMAKMSIERLDVRVAALEIDMVRMKERLSA